jgi:hypothetical protein
VIVWVLSSEYADHSAYRIERVYADEKRANEDKAFAEEQAAGTRTYRVTPADLIPIVVPQRSRRTT